MSSTPEWLRIVRDSMSSLRKATEYDNVYNDECIYSFDAPSLHRSSPTVIDGLFVNLQTREGVGRDYLGLDAMMTGCRVYLQILHYETPKLSNEDNSEEKNLPTKLAIGTKEGFDVDEKKEIRKEYKLWVLLQLPTSSSTSSSSSSVVLPKISEEDVVILPYPETKEIPPFLCGILDSIIEHCGMHERLEVASWEADTIRTISKYSQDLPFAPSDGPKNSSTVSTGYHPETGARQISHDPSTWKDDDSDATENLWLNLSTGHIGGGRKNWDGSGGSGTALEHYNATGKRYPLVVKLGTISETTADVWSYASEEDCLVIDPQLTQHLHRWGLDRSRLQKTAQSLTELEVEANLSYDWTRLSGANGELLKTVCGPCQVGLKNFGASCYMNSVLQVLFATTGIQQRYIDSHAKIMLAAAEKANAARTAGMSNGMGSASDGVAFDLTAQLSKLLVAMMTDRYVPLLEGENNFLPAPRMLKAIIGKLKSEFAKPGQQDAAEFLVALLEVLGDAEKRDADRFIGNEDSPLRLFSSLFEFHVERKSTCVNSGSSDVEVKFEATGPGTLHTLLDLPIPIDKAVYRDIPTSAGDETISKKARTDNDEVSSSPSAANIEQELTLDFQHCFNAWSDEEVFSQEHPRTKLVVPFTQTTRFATFPPFLLIKLNRYALPEAGESTPGTSAVTGEKPVHHKLGLAIPMPENLDLTSYGPLGLMQGETDISSYGTSSSASASSGPAPFTTQQLEIASQLEMMGFEKADIERAQRFLSPSADVEAVMGCIIDPPAASLETQAASSESAAKSNEPPSEIVEVLTAMGFGFDHCRAALRLNNNEVERALDWLFANSEDLDMAILQAEAIAESNASVNSTVSKRSTTSDPLDGQGKYTMVGMITHIGRGTASGHYLAHVKQGDRWVLFNDDKVGLVDSPPLSHGYIYLYRRDDHDASL